MSKSSSVRWYFNLSKWTPTHQDVLLATSCVQPEEKARLAKFVFRKDFDSSLIGRLMMRKFVSDACGVDYADFKLIRDERGRPLADKLSVSFNVSHHGDFTVFAGELGEISLGIDVMKREYAHGKKPLPEFFRIMHKNFSTREWQQIYHSTNGDDQIKTFYRLWTLKESYTKALGVGITIKLSELSFELRSPLSKDSYVDDTKLFVKGEELTGWSFKEILLDESHCVAVATDREVDDVKFRELTFGELMENAKAIIAEDEGYCLEYFKKLEKDF